MVDIGRVAVELSRVLNEPTKVANDIVRRALLYISRTKEAHLSFSHAAMMTFKVPATRKKPTDMKDNYETQDYNITDGITQEDDKINVEEYKHKGPTMHVVCQTDIDLAGQLETRQSTSSLMIRIQGAVVHWRAHTERIVIQSTAAEYIALSRGNTTAKFVRDILVFYGNGKPHYYLFTDNQAVEHIATQPNMNEHSRSIDIHHHAIRQDYIDGEMRIRGVSTQDNTSDILTKYLQPPLHQKTTRELNITQDTRIPFTNCVVTHTLRGHHRTHATQNCSLAQAQQLALDPAMKANRSRIRATQQNRDKNIGGPVRIRPTLHSETDPPAEYQVNCRNRHTCREKIEVSTGTVREILHKEDVMPGRRLQNSHRRPKDKQQNKVNRERKTLRPGSLNSIIPQPLPVFNRWPQHHSILDKPISNKTQRKFEKHRRRWEQNKKIRQTPAPNVHNHTSHKRIPPRTTICQPNDTYKRPDRGTTASPLNSHQAYKTTKEVHKWARRKIKNMTNIDKT
jgi:hypothetical protein